MKKIQYNSSSKIVNNIIAKVNLIIDKLVVDVKVNGTSVVVVNQEGEREADIDLSLSDQNVKQSPTTSSDNSDYRVLLSKSANDTEETDISRKDTNLKYNPSTGNLQTTKLNGNTVPSGSGNDTLAKLSDIPEAQTVTTGSVFGALSFDGTDKIVKLSADSQGSGLDLNDFKTAGEYYFDNNHTPLNIPVGNNGILMVLESVGIVKQIWMRHGTKDSNDFQSFVRTCYLSSGNWSAWHPIISGGTVSSVEPTTTASKAYAVGDYLMCRGFLYRVTLAISSGDTIAVNTNVARAYIGNELTDIRNSVPTALSDLTDDSTHRLVTDTEKSTWNGKAELTDVDKAELNTWNLLRQPYFHGSGTSSGITRTVNADGSVTFTGTATASFYFNLKRYTQEWKLPKGTYRVSGCPSGGSSSTYFLRVAKYTTSSTTLVDEYGDGAEFTLTEESVMQISAAVINGYAIQGSLTFKPSIIPIEKVEQNEVAPIENGDTASQAYTIGDYMFWRGGFYVVRADIASGDAIASGTNVEATDLGSEVKKSKIWGNENIATIPNSSSSSKVYVTTSAYATEIYVQRMNIRSTSLGINETGYCSVTIPILPSMTNNYFVFMFRGDVDNKLYDGRLLFKKDSNGVYGYVSKVYQDGVLKSANDLEADIVVFEKS